MTDRTTAPRMNFMQAPFPYFGGKSKIAHLVWQRFGDVKNYVEPFFGSGAVLLGAPWPSRRIETVNDADAFVCNFWRALKRDPDAMAELVDWPINECDLEARHKWLVQSARKAELLSKVRDDPDYCDVQIAAWWCWGRCAWIGSGWCEGQWYGPNDPRNQGVRSQLPQLGRGQGVHSRRVFRSRTDGGPPCRDWFRALANRLRKVRVCCGDWSRVTTRTPTLNLGLTAVFLDPPYSADASRYTRIYRVESPTVAHDVREWAIEQGRNPLMRIALCGYEGEHKMPDDWTCVAWRAQGGYGITRRQKDYMNMYRERIWFSPHCVKEHLF